MFTNCVFTLDLGSAAKLKEKQELRNIILKHNGVISYIVTKRYARCYDLLVKFFSFSLIFLNWYHANYLFILLLNAFYCLPSTNFEFC